MKTRARKLLSLTLALLMCFSLFPASVFADEAEPVIVEEEIFQDESTETAEEEVLSDSENAAAPADPDYEVIKEEVFFTIPEVTETEAGQYDGGADDGAPILPAGEHTDVELHGSETPYYQPDERSFCFIPGSTGTYRLFFAELQHPEDSYLSVSISTGGEPFANYAIGWNERSNELVYVDLEAGNSYLVTLRKPFR